MDLYESTLSSSISGSSGPMGAWIHMSGVAQDTLHPICGKITQLQNTEYLAPIKRSQIEGSVVCRNH